jgi:glutathione S-transferase
MSLIEIVTVLALLQYLTFAALVGRARAKYGVKAPATTGNEVFERFYRVQMNTLELLVVFLPALWLAARYWSPTFVSGIGAIFLIGLVLYYRAYTREPSTRSLGFNLSLGPALLLLLAGLVGAVLAGLK